MLGLLTTVLGIGSKIVDRLVPDKAKAQDQEHEARIANIGIVREQASSGFWFVAAARAAMTWMFVCALGWLVIIAPMLNAYTGTKYETVAPSDVLKLLLPAVMP